jgi:DNA-directed RNA polymerase subunit M/transcription elongation factor TFIIS
MEIQRKTCPACGGGEYTFRSRKTVETQGKHETETKYRCKKCEHEWKVRIPKQEAGNAGGVGEPRR